MRRMRRTLRIRRGKQAERGTSGACFPSTACVCSVLLRRCLHMWIRHDFCVNRYNGTVVHACGCNDQLVGRITMKRPRQLRGLYNNPWCEFQQSDAGIGKCLAEPCLNWTWQREATILHEFGDFPTRNDTNPKTLRLMPFYIQAVMMGQVRIAVDPPHPNVCIQNNHCTASQSAWATTSVGSR